MNTKDTNITILFRASKSIPPEAKEIDFDKYKIYSIPTKKESLFDTHENAILEFIDHWEEQTYSHPEGEGRYVLSLLSLIFRMQVEFDSVKINNVQVTLTRKKRPAYFSGKMEIPLDLGNLFRKINSLDIGTLRQFIRSCATYQTAISLVDQNPTLTFFLLVTAIECISNVVIKKADKFENFKEFILTFLPKHLETELEDKELFLELLREAYKMRSAFTHGGREISIGSISADDLNRKYIKHYVEGNETKSPSLVWFEGIVQGVLLEFLKRQKVKKEKGLNLSNLAKEAAVIYLKTKRPVKSGRIVFVGDVDLE